MNEYATDTEGIPKTDFVKMLSIAKSMVSAGVITPDIAECALRRNGAEAGTFLFEECAALESIVKSADFNVFKEDGQVGTQIERMVGVLTYIYQARLQVRELGDSHPELFPKALEVSEDYAYGLVSVLVNVASQKDKEYGASWCKRGGIGAWFTTVRKFDRIATQLKQLNFNLWDVSYDVAETESLEETLKDGINYLLLVAEKRAAIQVEWGKTH
jgi:hypothetical protein